MNKKSLSIIVVVILIVAGVAGFLGYEYTHPKKTNLPAFKITALSPLNSVETAELDSIITDLKAIGIPASISLVSPTVQGTWLSPNSTPQFADLGWLPDWPDPVAQQFQPFATYSNGGAFGANNAWVNNTTLNKAFPGVVFTSNKTAQMNQVISLYHTFYDQYSYIWLPNPTYYFFVQPYINNFTYNAYQGYYYNMMSYNKSYTGGGNQHPSNNTTLTDVSDATSLAAPDFLDPSHGFFVQDGPMFTAAYQQLYELNGTNFNQVVPVLAKTPANNTSSNFQNYNITLRNNIHFNNSDPVNASTIWFSLYRTLVMAQGVSVDNYGGTLFNSTAYGATAPYSLPVGFLKDMRHAYNVTHASGLQLPDPSNYSNLNMSNTVFAANYLAHMLSHYQPWSNSTQAYLLNFTNQAVSVPTYTLSNANTLNFSINLLNPYPFFLQDMAEWWGNIADPLFLDSHDGVIATSPNNYTDVHGMPGTGPYHISTVGASLDSVTLARVSNYWGNQYWNNVTGTGTDGFPAMAQPAHIKTIVMDYTVDHSGRVSGFLDNTYQLSYVSASYLGSIIGVSPFKNVPTTSYFHNVGAVPAAYDISMNNFITPTNNTLFREAIYYAVNYTALNAPFNYKLPNGTTDLLAQDYIGPISPSFSSFYNNATAGLALPQQNIPLAEHYLNVSLREMHYYVTLPNGTKLGDTSISSSSLLVLSAVHSMEQLVENMEIAAVRIF